MTLDGHRSDDDAPYVFITEDAGETWRSLTANLPEGAGSTRTIAEDPVNQNLLYLGTEFGAYVSLDRGSNWTRFHGDLPTVAVHAFAVHVASGEVVAGTHGRSLWITSVNELRQMTNEVLAQQAHFYKPLPAVIWRSALSTGGTNRRFVAENPADGARFVYHLKEKVGKAVLEVADGSGKVQKRIEGSIEPGLHVLQWNLRGAPRIPDGVSERARQWYMRRGGARVAPGAYTARLRIDGVVHAQPLVVENRPRASRSLVAAERRAGRTARVPDPTGRAGLRRR